MTAFVELEWQMMMPDSVDKHFRFPAFSMSSAVKRFFI